MGTTDQVPWGHCFVDPDSGEPARIDLRQVDSKTFVLGSSLRYTGNPGIDDIPAAALTLRPQDLGPRCETDLASVPTALQWFLSRYGIHTPAALLHDRLTGAPGLEGVTEPQADRFFRFMLQELGVPWLRRWMMWAAVALRTRWKSGPRRKATVFAWFVASLAGQVVAVVALLQANWLLLAAAFLAPIPFALLWSRQYAAGLLASYTAPWVLPPTLLGAVGFGAYWVSETIAKGVGTLWKRLHREPPPRNAGPMSYSEF